MNFCLNNVLLRNLLQINKCFHKNQIKFLSTNTNSGVNYEIIEPFERTPKKRVFSDGIEKPDYVVNGLVSDAYDLIKSDEQIRGITTSCVIAKNILTKVGQQLKVGISGEDIDDMVFQLCESYRCYPSPLNYRGFPSCVTTSVNNIAVHGIPDKRRLIDGDIITIDVSIYYKGFHGDCAHTFIIGQSDPKARHLLKVAELCLYKAIDICKDGQKLATIGKTIQTIAKQNGLNVIPAFCGHGIGHNLHEPPQVLHCDHNSKQTIRENMCITIEPVITEGSEDVVIDDTDGWTVYTEDNQRTAQFEHTIWVKRENAVILTQI